MGGTLANILADHREFIDPLNDEKREA